MTSSFAVSRYCGSSPEGLGDANRLGYGVGVGVSVGVGVGVGAGVGVGGGLGTTQLSRRLPPVLSHRVTVSWLSISTELEP